MQLQVLLAREALSAKIRVLVGTAVCLWRADWPCMQDWIALARSHGSERQDLEETLLQCVLFCGFPRVITAFEQLAIAWSSEHPPSGGSLPAQQRAAAGNELFGTIYGKNDRAVREMLRSYHGELHDFVLDAAYGRILTRPHLPSLTRELIAVGVLAAQGQRRQFAGHGRGALHMGATREQLREVLLTTFAGCAEQEGTIEAWLQRVK